MIELKISTSAALNILLERMEFELNMRQNSGILPPYTELKQLTYKQLIDIVEFAVMDLIFLIPIDIIISKNNLPDIISRAVNELSNVYNYYEFNSYSINRAEVLVSQIKGLFLKTKNDPKFIYN
jgi:hypothetical protein